jgi:LPXTG-motif cell wall-anchored protein
MSFLACAVLAIAAMPAAAGAAGADGATSACSITFSPEPTQIPQGQKTDVTVTVQASPGKYATLYVPGQSEPVGPSQTDGTGKVIFHVTVIPPVDVTVGITDSASSAYPLNGSCTDPFSGIPVGGEVVTRDTTTRALALTGSSQTPTYVLVGVGALVVGLVILVAARRRAHANG